MLVAFLAEGVDRNLEDETMSVIIRVAFLAEGVDRNQLRAELYPRTARVAFLAEGVDRNDSDQIIELAALVAFLAEGVDRNSPYFYALLRMWCRLPRGGRG